VSQVQIDQHLKKITKFFSSLPN